MVSVHGRQTGPVSESVRVRRVEQRTTSGLREDWEESRLPECGVLVAEVVLRYTINAIQVRTD